MLKVLNSRLPAKAVILGPETFSLEFPHKREREIFFWGGKFYPGNAGMHQRGEGGERQENVDVK